MSDIIDRITSQWTDEYRRQAAPLIARLKELIAKGIPVEQAVNLAFAETGFSGKIADELKQSLGTAAGGGFGVTISLASKLAIGEKLFEHSWTADKLKLSSRLHGTDAIMRQSITKAVGDQIKVGTNWVQMARKLYDGYGFPETIKRAQLPAYLDALVKAAQKSTSDDSRAIQDIKRLARIAKRNIEKLGQDGAPNQALKAAYTQLLETAQQGTQRALDRTINMVINEKSRYYAERVARTEISRAWSEGFWAKHYDDPDVVAVRWRLSSRHPQFDVCDVHANANFYGLGKGVYPKNANPPHPAHPHCTCILSQVYEGEVDPIGAKFDPAAGDRYLRSLDDQKQQDLLGAAGVKAWKQGDSWQGRLRNWQGRLRNWQGHDDPRPRLTKEDFPTPAVPVVAPTLPLSNIDAALLNIPQIRRNQLRADYEAAPEVMRNIVSKVAQDTTYADIPASITSHYGWNNQINMSAKKTIAEYNRTFWHELGHAVDHQIVKKLGAKGWTASSSSWKGSFTDFQQAIKKDVAKFKQLTYNELTKKTPNSIAKAELREKVHAGVVYQGAPFRDNAAVSDIFCGITNRKIMGNYGHKASYWKLGPERASMETFANLWQLYFNNDTAAIAFLKETLPQTIAEFEKIIKQYGA